VYRTEFDATPDTVCVALRASFKGFLVLRVNGHIAFEHSSAPKAKPSPRASAFWGRVSGDTADVVLTRGIRPGGNVLSVSTSTEGVTLDGAAIERSGAMKRLSSSQSWLAMKFPPATFLRHEKSLNTPGEVKGWLKVTAGQQDLSISDEEIKAITSKALKKRLAEAKTDLAWRLNMLQTRGYVVDDWEPFGFGGAGRLSDDVLAVALTLRDQLKTASAEIDIYKIQDGVNALSLIVRLRDESESLANAASVMKGKAPEAEKKAMQAAEGFRRLADVVLNDLRRGKQDRARFELQGVREEMDLAYTTVEATWKNVVNRLNESDANRFGWFDVKYILDNDVKLWGLRLGDVRISWKMNLNGRWRFKLDPKNTGLQETVHDTAYNIEGQWPEVTVPGDWEHQGYRKVNPNVKATNPFPGINDSLEDGPYNGWAWYRKTLQIPVEWAGYDLELRIARIDDYDWTYFNGKEIGHTAHDTNPKDFWRAPRRYHVPKEQVRFGGINVFAVRVFDCRDKGGILGDVELRCPGLRSTFQNRPADTKVKPTLQYSSPLTIGALMTAGQDPIKLWGWNERGIRGPKAILLPLKRGVETRQISKTEEVFNPRQHSDLKENWALLWPGDNADKPVLVVFLDRPAAISANVGEGKGTSAIEITFKKKGARFLLARPFRDISSSDDKLSPGIVNTCRFWARALLAYPVSFTEVNERLADDPWMLNITDIYSFRTLKDAWGTEPVKLAILPPYLSFAIESKYPGVRFPKGVKDLDYTMGKFGRLHAAVDADRASYRVPLDPMPAFGGTTAFAFSPIDIGKGNVPEVREVSLFGGNGWRPQTVIGPGPELDYPIRTGQELGVNILVNGCIGYAKGADKIPGLYERLAKAYRGLPFKVVSYDPFNEPASLKSAEYNRLVRKTVETIRRHDKTHLIYIESPESFASVMMMDMIDPIDDPKIVYSFHDYDYRLSKFWPNERISISNVYEGWAAAFEFMIKRHVPIHLGEWGGYEQRDAPWVWTRPHTIAQTLDMCRIFQHFHMHFHYYSNRGTTRFAADGGLDQSYVQEGFARFFRKGHYNFYHELDRP